LAITLRDQTMSFGQQAAVMQAHQTSSIAPKWAGAGIIALYLIFYLLPLGVRPLAIPDETRYAEISREMLSTGDWVVPHLNGLRYFEKPPLTYWANAISIFLFGENPFAVRLPGALAVGLTLLLVFFFAQFASASRAMGIWAALIYMSFLSVFAIGNFGVPDNLLTLFLSAGIVAFYLAAEEKNSNRALGLWVISGVSLGLAFLSKGFLAFALPVLVLAPWMLWQGRWRTLLTFGWLVVLAATFVVLPWAILIHLREGDFWHYFFWVEHIKRFAAENAQHKAPFYYYLMNLPALAFPWLALLPASVASALMRKDKDANRSTVRLLWLWLLLPFIFFSYSSGKLASYILPCFPPLAILISLGLYPYLHGERTKLFDFGVLFNLLCLIGMLITLVVSQNFDVGIYIYGEDESMRAIVLGVALATATVGGLVAFLTRRPGLRMSGVLFMVLPLLLIISSVLPNRMRESTVPGPFLLQHRDLIQADTILVSSGNLIRAVNWYFQRDDVYLTNAHELRYGLGYLGAAGRLLGAKEFSALLVQNQNRHAVALFCENACAGQYTNSLPTTALKYRYGVFELWYVPSNDTSTAQGKTVAGDAFP